LNYVTELFVCPRRQIARAKLWKSH